MTLSLAPQQSWDPLPAEQWNQEAAQHLLRRAGWSAIPSEVLRATQEGLPATLERLFPERPALLPEPELIARDEERTLALQQQAAVAPPEEKRNLQRQIREHSQEALLDLTVKWLQFSAQPANAAYQKWVLFLSDVYVVSFEKVPRAPLIYRHFDLLARLGLGPAPALAKAVSRSPAMILYLDLNQNRPEAPNENFARELFELFLLGEGNYSEQDIKESARAFTGYRLGRAGREFLFAPRQHDNGPKTIFGQTGNFSGDDVIDLAYGTRAAGAFLPHELVKFYLSDAMLPPDTLDALGARWRAQGYNLRWLAHRFFGSRLFFAPEFRAAFIKSPVQYYLGLMQDLELDVAPAPRLVVGPLRQMGQVLFRPPNVRGWVGGRAWINSGSLAARRGLAESLFNPLNERALNQDELVAVAAARGAGQANFRVADERLEPLLGAGPDGAAERLCSALLAAPPAPAYLADLRAYLAGAGPGEPEARRRVRRALISTLAAAEYQLC
jgi:uncharacterized protein (DUF1800 family)